MIESEVQKIMDILTKGLLLAQMKTFREHTMDPVAEENSEADNNLEMLCSTYVLFPSNYGIWKKLLGCNKELEIEGSIFFVQFYILGSLFCSTDMCLCLFKTTLF